MPTPLINDNGIWREPKQIYINDNGIWRHGKELWVRRNGVWRQIFKRALQLSIDADTLDYDLFTAAGSPVDPLDIVLTIGLNVLVGASTTATAALYTSAPLPAGSELFVKNKGSIIGAGGKGGNYVNYNYHPGGDGGTAMALAAPTLIDNTGGYIFGGGGGGAAAEAKRDSNLYEFRIAGGGGAGSTPGIGGILHDNRWPLAESGRLTTGGRSRYDYPSWHGTSYLDSKYCNGGAVGAPGAHHTGSMSTSPPYDRVRTANGGAAGRAVERNGFGIVFVGGENADQLKGAYD